MPFSLGPNPVDAVLAYRGAIESSLDIPSSINECCENGRDYGDNVTVRLIGSPIKNKPGYIDLTEVVIEDDGQGMNFATLYEKFRGAYFDSSSHGSSSQSGRNGVGVKTNLQYWNRIYVETTTRGLIPFKTQWNCNSDVDILDSIYRKASKLKPGDPDTEVRAMTLCVDGAELEDFKACLSDDAWTKVTLKNPRQKIEFCVDDFIRKQSHCIEWLSDKRHALKVYYPNENGKSVGVDIRPFYEVEKVEKSMCHVKGNSKQDMHILFHGKSGTKESQIIVANTDPNLGLVDLDIKVLDREKDDNEPKNRGDFVISICGANIHDRGVKRNSNVSPSVDYLIGQGHFNTVQGFSYRLHGFIKTNDPRLKRALRHNKSTLDEEDKYCKVFIDYVINTILIPLNRLYNDNLKEDTTQGEKEILLEISKEFQDVMKRVSDKQQVKVLKTANNSSSKSKHKEFKCNACQMVWKTPADKSPSYCAEFNIVDEKGCGSRDIDRNTHIKVEAGLSNTNFKWVKPLGGFMPARYDPIDNCILLSMYHPSFLTPLTGVKARTHVITVGVEKAFFAVACYKATKEERTVDEVYSELLREWFENKTSTDKHKGYCRKVWKEHKLSVDQI